MCGPEGRGRLNGGEDYFVTWMVMVLEVMEPAKRLTGPVGERSVSAASS